MTAVSFLLYFIGCAAIVIGFMGSILPVLPGPPMIWLGTLLWAWGNDFQKIGWPTLTILGILALAGMLLNFVFTTSLSRRAGVSWRAIGGALVGAFAGGLMLTAIPLIGTLTGALAGAVVGMWIIEYLVRQDSRMATNAVRAYLSGATLSAAVQFVIACLMLSIFVWQAFF